MKNWAKRFWLDRLNGQIAILVLVAILLFHATLTIAFSLLGDRDRPPPPPGRAADHIAGLAVAVDAASEAERAQALSDIVRVFPQIQASIVDRLPALISGAARSPFIDELRRRLWTGADVHLVESDAGYDSLAVAIGLRKGGFIFAKKPRPPPEGVEPSPTDPRGPGSPPPRPPRGPPSWSVWFGSALFFFLCATILAMWASNAIIAPLVQLAQQAEKFPGELRDQSPIKEQGPQEVRDLTRALNRMQSRIFSMLEARARFSAAISHDLRTILTRVRLRCEFVDDETVRSKMLQDVELMDSMLYKNLQRLQENHEAAERKLLDLDSVLQSVVDDFVDLGRKVTYRGGQRQMIQGSLADVQRLFNNLIENAVTYAGCADVVVTQPTTGCVQIDVVDEGPGVSVQDKERLTAPFVRGASRDLQAPAGFASGSSSPAASRKRWKDDWSSLIASRMV